jgi:hypothetical protein
LVGFHRHNQRLRSGAGPLSAPNTAGRERRLSGDGNYLVVSGISSDSRIKETRRKRPGFLYIALRLPAFSIHGVCNRLSGRVTGVVAPHHAERLHPWR